MKSTLLQTLFRLLLTALLAHSSLTYALTTCSVSSPGFANGYVPSNPTTSITSNTFTVTCIRDNAGRRPIVTVRYKIKANKGLNALGKQNRAALTGSFLNYHLAVDAACATPWQGKRKIPQPRGRLDVAKNSTASATHIFYGCIPAGQTVLPPAGTYTDTVTMKFKPGKVRGRSVFTRGSLPISIVAPATCVNTAPPANLAFNYTAFSATPVLTSTSFGIRCTTSLVYTISLDAIDDVVAGLNYTLGLNTVGTGGVNPLVIVGTGIPQTFFINGSMPAGQPGACNTAAPCTAAQVRTLTVTY